MADLFYTGLGKKAYKTGHLTRSVEKLSFLSNKKINFDLYTEKEIIEGYCNDLLILLEEEDLKAMISSIFQMRGQLQILCDERNMDICPTLDDFFSQLSPLFMQVVWENIDQEADQFMLFKKWKEAIRISLEEELYLWQDRGTQF